MKRAIVTGATGMIGTALIQNLISHNIEVLVLVREESTKKDLIPVSSLVKIKNCSLAGLSFLQNDGSAYDVFYHLGWDKTSGDGRNDFYTQNLNVRYTLDAVGLAKRFGCKTFVGAGSQAEYGRVNAPLKGDTPCNPENGYGMAKLCAGYMSRGYAERLGLTHVWARICSVYGKNGGSDLITYLTSALSRGEEINCTKGEQIWDYLYSKDIANALYLLGKKGQAGKVYPLGSGIGKPLKEYVEEVKEIINPQAVINYGARAYSESEVMHLVADISEIERDTGWSPQYSFGEGIKDMLK